jgi:hypothetical protein
MDRMAPPRSALAAALLSLLAATPAPAAAQPSGPTLQGRVFADFNYLDSQRGVPEGFRAGQLAGHLVAELSRRIAFFGEATATPSASGFALEAERVILRYDHSDALKLSAGRYHTPVSYWNTAFHHGQWLQTTTTRPEMIRLGSTLLPVHFVGLLAEGAVAAGPLGFGYTAGVGNGRGTNVARGGDAGDANNSRALLAGATLRLPRAVGLRLGGAYYADRLTPAAGVDMDERILSAHLAGERETPEILAEYARIRHAPRAGAPGAVAVTHAYYGQLAYRLPGRAQAFKPYARYERDRVPAADPVLAPLRLDYEGLTGGVRVDVAAVAALKFEYRGERSQGGRRMRTLVAQLSFTFPGTAEHAHDVPAVAEGRATPRGPAAAGAHHD